MSDSHYGKNLRRRFWGWIPRILRRPDRPRRRDKDQCLTAGELNALLRKEYSRASRYGYPLSLIVFDLRTRGQELQLAESQADALIERVRSSDRVGWFDENHVAVMLPHTTGHSAWSLADDLVARFRLMQMEKDSGGGTPYFVYAYPHDDESELADSRTQNLVERLG